MSVLAEYLADVAHIKGGQNIVADGVSRPALAAQIEACDFTEIVQAETTELKKISRIEWKWLCPT